MESTFGGLREAMTEDMETLSAVQERFQAVSSGLQVTEGGQSSLQDQLMGENILYKGIYRRINS